MEVGDGLPPYICQKCVVKLNVAFQFKVQCESSDARLRSCFNNIQHISSDSIHISGTDYVPNIKADSELSNSSISITFTTHDGSLDNNTLQIQEVNNITDSGCITTQETLQSQPTDDNQFGNIENTSSFCELAKVTLTELKLDFGGHKLNDNNLKVSERNLDLSSNLLVKNTKPKKVENHQCGTCGKIFKTKPSKLFTYNEEHLKNFIYENNS